MWQQKQNNFAGLDELESLPDETTSDKTALWQRLEDKMQKKPKQVKLWRYCVAACLLICAIIPLLFTGSNTKSGTAKIDKTPRASEQIILQPTENTKTAIVIEHLQPKKNEINLPFVVKNFVSDKNRLPVRKVIKDSFITKGNVVLENIPSVALSVNVDTVTTAVLTTSKKKISIVHINELQEEDRVAEQNTNTARSLKRYPTKNADKKAYAGVLNFRIYFKN